MDQGWCPDGAEDGRVRGRGEGAPRCCFVERQGCQDGGGCQVRGWVAGVVLHHQVTVQQEGAGFVELLLARPQRGPGEAREEGLGARRDELKLQNRQRIRKYVD